jgi:diguanylate cyclase (GGDEF)-like protein/PAS domain S-box-containing protein
MREATPEISARVAHEQTRLLYRHGYSALGGALACWIVASYILRPWTDAIAWVCWSGSVLAIYLVRIAGIARFFRQAIIDDDGWKRWRRFYVLAAALSGLAWGAGAFILPDRLAIETLFALLVGGMSATSATAYSAVRGAGEAFALPAMSMVTIYLASKSGEIYLTMSLLLVVHTAITLITARRMHRAVADNIRYALEMERVTQRLRQSQAETDALNASLKSEMERRARDAEAIRRSEEDLRMILENMQDVFYRTDMDGLILRFSPSVEKLLGYRPDELVGKPVQLLYLHPDEKGRLLRQLESNGGYVTGYQTQLRRRDGECVWVSVNANHYRDQAGRTMGLEGTVRDIAENKKLEDELWRLANFDALTGLPNRRLFYDRLGLSLVRALRGAESGALLFIDLDRFKEVNDELGHDCGDEYLRETARRLSDCVRKSDTVARIGGDEFTIILQDIKSAANAELFVEKIRAALARPFWLKGKQRGIGASIGLALFPDEGVEPDELMKQVDLRMYTEKQPRARQEAAA